MVQVPTIVTTALAALFTLAGRPTAHAQEEPSFDCRTARTQIEHVLCSGGNSGMGWIDQTMAHLYDAALQAPKTDPAALRASQRAWLARRDRCAGTDIQAMSCLAASYRARFAAIAAAYDTAHLTGAYSNAEVNGFLDAVLFPDHTLAVNAASSTGGPAYASCGLTLHAPLTNGRLGYDPASDGDTGEGACRFDLTTSPGHIDIERHGCDAFCGNGAAITGTYRRVR